MTAEVAVARQAFRRLCLTATVWALVFGGLIASSALTFASTYPTAASRRGVAAATATDRGLAVLLGPVSDIGTVGGYTVYKCFVVLTCIGAIWALLVTTRLLRGEEDAGRWQIVVAGGIRSRRATAATLTGIGAAVLVVASGATVITALAGTDSRLSFSASATVLYGCSLAVVPVAFLGVGALVSQLARSRRVANLLGMAAFVLTMLVRMAADSGSSARWMLWFTPFGWVERVRPFTAPDWLPIIVAFGVSAVLVAAALVLAGRRDVGDGVVVAADRTEVRPFGLTSVGGFIVREQLSSLSGWLIGITVGAVALGVIAEAVHDALSRSSIETLQKLGVTGTLVEDYFGVAFLLLAAVVALVPAPQITAAAEDDTEGRLTVLLALPVARSRLFIFRLVLVAATVVAAAALAGAAAWLGASSQGVDIGFSTLLGAGLNVVPVALVALGIGALVLAIAPRAAAPSVYAVVIGSLVIDLLASLVTSTRWLERLSLFHYMALAPGRAVDWGSTVALLGVALALSGVATALFVWRDLTTR